VIGRPFVEKATLNLQNGKRFTVSTDHLDAKHPYVGKVTLNGKDLARTWVTHEELTAGGELHFSMQAEPSKWGTAADAAPYSMSTSKQ
jgi:putative alpha-1,2-mannosidase